MSTHPPGRRAPARAAAEYSLGLTGAPAGNAGASPPNRSAS